jgi:hypothetical protein
MRGFIALLLSLLAVSLTATAAERLRFWNLTAFTIKELHLAPAGTRDWGPDQCRNDPDGAVDPDERLTLKDIVPGHYDVKLADKKGRVCVVRNVEVLAGKPYAFSISEKDLTQKSSGAGHSSARGSAPCSRFCFIRAPVKPLRAVTASPSLAHRRRVLACRVCS